MVATYYSNSLYSLPSAKIGPTLHKWRNTTTEDKDLGFLAYVLLWF